jgi:hypothetical protein
MSKLLHLSQIIALDKTIKARMHSNTSDLYKKLQKSDLFVGQNREYHPLDDDDKELIPTETKKVQHTVADILKATQKSLTEFWDISVRREHANTKAFADVVVDEIIILEKMPVGMLLFLEKQLIDLKTTFQHIPVLDPSEDWDLDKNNNLFRTKELRTHRTKKTPRVIIKYDATEHHPAQTEIFNEDNIVGYYHVTKLSGAMRPVDKENLMGKIEKLINAVKIAREEANSFKEEKVNQVSLAIFGYLGFEA